MTALSAHLAIPLGQLRAQFTGRVLTPDDAAYDAARSVFIGGVDRRPAVIIRPADASEVARVVTLARETGLQLAVRSGGHSLAGHSVCDGGIVLDLSAMRRLDIDVERRTAWAQTGLTASTPPPRASTAWRPGFGDTASVGIGGLTFGGGIAFLVRKHGLSIAAQLVGEATGAVAKFCAVTGGHMTIQDGKRARRWHSTSSQAGRLGTCSRGRNHAPARRDDLRGDTGLRLRSARAPRKCEAGDDDIGAAGGDPSWSGSGRSP